MQSETPVASHATPHFWRETRMKTLQARQVDLSRLRRSLGCFAAIFHPEIHEVDLWQVYTEKRKIEKETFRYIDSLILHFNLTPHSLQKNIELK